MSAFRTRLLSALSGLLLVAACKPAATPAPATELLACRLPGVANEVRCGAIDVAEDPGDAGGTGRRLKIHFAVVPALAKNKAPDPIFVFAGGPGQAATRVARQVLPLFAKLNTRRDIVFVDQRGTGQSNGLDCADAETRRGLADLVELQAQLERLSECLRTLDADTRHYATWIAMRDIDAVRAALGYAQINLWGGSYGTRAALEYLRAFPQHVRTATLDGAAPADVRLPASFTLDAAAALDTLIERCRKDKACAARYPRLAADIDALFARTAARTRVTVHDPLSGEQEKVLLSPDTLSAALRTPLYVPQLAALLPHAIARAAQGDYDALFAVIGAVGGDDSMRIAWGQHFAVICAEDMPRIGELERAAAAATRFGTAFIDVYAQACAQVPHTPAPTAFYEAPRSAAPVLVLSGGADPATPPRHGEAVAHRLQNARHLVGPHLGHGVSGHGCAPELIARFIRQASFEGVDGACLQQLPAPLFFVPPDGGTTNLPSLSRGGAGVGIGFLPKPSDRNPSPKSSNRNPSPPLPPSLEGEGKKMGGFAAKS